MQYIVDALRNCYTQTSRSSVLLMPIKSSEQFFDIGASNNAIGFTCCQLRNCASKAMFSKWPETEVMTIVAFLCWRTSCWNS